MNKHTVALLEQHFDTAFSAPDGIKKLRELILTLAMQGKLVPQDPDDPPASELLKEIRLTQRREDTKGKSKKEKELPEIKPEEIPYPLPKGWVWARLGEICEYNGRENVAPESIDSDVWLLDLEDIEKDTSRLIYRAKYSERQSKSTKSKFQKGDVLYGKLRPYLDKVIVADNDGVCTTEIVPIVPYQVVNSEFLRLLLKRPAFLGYVNSLMYGVKMPRLGTEDAVQSIHPLPPFLEQHRIVAKIDELMARCDAMEKLRTAQEEKRLAVHTATIKQLLNIAAPEEHLRAQAFLAEHFADLYTVKANVAELRKAILQLAVMGKLVPQDPNDPPASELLNEIEAEKKRLVKEGKLKRHKPLTAINPKETPFQLPVKWQWARVWDIAELITSGSRDWAKYYSDSGAIFVTMGNLSRGNYQLRMDNLRYVNPPEDGEGSRTKLEENDLLISITGDVGNLGLIPQDFGDAYINQHTCLLRIMAVCRNRYFPELMRSPLAKTQFDAPQRGIKNSFRLGDVGEMIIPVPPLAEQHRIVAKIDQLMLLCDSLDKLIHDATAKKNALLNAVMAEM